MSKLLIAILSFILGNAIGILLMINLFNEKENKK